MKKTKILYWVFTVLFAGFMLFSAIPDAMMDPRAVEFVKGHLGYPEFFIIFIGIAKILGSVVLLIPGFNRLKEWAYAGLFFDLVAATYSIIAVDGFELSILFILLPIAVLFLSYSFHHRLLLLRQNM
jgi:hypothetical protein